MKRDVLVMLLVALGLLAFTLGCGINPCGGWLNCGPGPAPTPPPAVCQSPPGPVCADADAACGCFICDARSNFEWAPQPACPTPEPVPVPTPTPCAPCVEPTPCPEGQQRQTSGHTPFPCNCSIYGECFDPTPTPAPTPRPTPRPTPTPIGPYPCGTLMECEAWGLCPFEVDTLSHVGIALLNVVPVKTQGGIYLGKRYVVHATPHSVPPFCPHQPDRQRCEQITACQAKEGPDFYISLPGKFHNDRCDKQSSNAFICHHKPKADEAGPTTFCAVPKGEPPNSTRGRCVTVDVR